MNELFTDYVSPKDGTELRQENDHLIDKVGNKFPIVNKIPRFVSNDNYSSSFGFQWNIFNQTQVDQYNKSSITLNRFYQTTLLNNDILQGKKVLEVGSGSGRFTQILLETGRRRNTNRDIVQEAGICHGLLGIAHIYQRMYNYTKINEFYEIAQYWYEQTLSFIDQTGGMEDYKTWDILSEQFVSNPTLIDGKAGIGLCLISSISEIEPKWDRFMLLS